MQDKRRTAPPKQAFPRKNIILTQTDFGTELLAGESDQRQLGESLKEIAINRLNVIVHRDGLLPSRFDYVTVLVGKSSSAARSLLPTFFIL